MENVVYFPPILVYGMEAWEGRGEKSGANGKPIIFSDVSHGSVGGGGYRGEGKGGEGGNNI